MVCRWVDDHLVHLLSPNIYRSPSEALEAFGYIAESGNFSTTERITAKYFGAAAMYFISKRLKKRHNIGDERLSLYEAADTWVKALDGRKFMGGEMPNLADLAVFGVLRPIRNLRSGEDMVANSSIGTWYSNMEKAVGASSRLAPSFQNAELRKPVESTVGG
jgi:microsomal prostaglandin-E synthase 2